MYQTTDDDDAMMIPHDDFTGAQASGSGAVVTARRASLRCTYAPVVWWRVDDAESEDEADEEGENEDEGEGSEAGGNEGMAAARAARFEAEGGYTLAWRRHAWVVARGGVARSSTC